VIFGPLNLKARPLPSLPAAAGIRYGSLESPARSFTRVTAAFEFFETSPTRSDVCRRHCS